MPITRAYTAGSMSLLFMLIMMCLPSPKGPVYTSGHYRSDFTPHTSYKEPSKLFALYDVFCIKDIELYRL